MVLLKGVSKRLFHFRSIVKGGANLTEKCFYTDFLVTYVFDF